MAVGDQIDTVDNVAGTTYGRLDVGAYAPVAVVLLQLSSVFLFLVDVTFSKERFDIFFRR